MSACNVFTKYSVELSCTRQFDSADLKLFGIQFEKPRFNWYWIWRDSIVFGKTYYNTVIQDPLLLPVYNLLDSLGSRRHLGEFYQSRGHCGLLHGLLGPLDRVGALRAHAHHSSLDMYRSRQAHFLEHHLEKIDKCILASEWWLKQLLLCRKAST